MKKLGDMLCIEWAEAVKSGISNDALLKANYRDSDTFKILQDPSDKRKRLIQYDSLNEKYKQLIDTRLCNGIPATEWFKKQMSDEDKSKAHELLLNNAKTGINTEEYTQLEQVYGAKKGYALAFIASVIRIITSVNGKKDAQKYYCSSKDALIQVAMELIKREHFDYSFENIAYFRRKIRNYEANGLESLISKKLGMTNAQKMDESQLLLVAKLWTDGRKFSTCEIHRLYYTICQEKNWQPVTRQNLINLINGKLTLSKDFKNICSELRYGSKYAHDELTLVISRNKPKHPDALWSMDGTPFELFYRNEKGALDRMYVYVVVDAYSWKIVGYKIGSSETGDVAYDAMKMACISNGRLPYQLQFDNSSAQKKAENMEWYRRIAKYVTPTDIGVSRMKVVEPIWGHISRKILKFFPNHSGGNIIAKSIETHVNPDFIKENVKDFPNKDGVIAQINEVIALWNNTMIEKWKATPNTLYSGVYEGKREITFDMQVSLFWKWRMRGIKNATMLEYTYTFKGLTIEYNSTEEPITYIVGTTPNEIADFLLSSRDKTFWVKFDPDHKEMIALYEPSDNVENAKFVAYAVEKEKAAMDIHTSTPEEQAAYKKMRAAQKLQKEMAKDRFEEIKNIPGAEDILKIPITVKSRYKDEYNSAEAEIKRLSVGGFIKGVVENTKPLDLSIKNLYAEDGEEGGIVGSVKTDN